jgi:RimJ/RimL family protein N-acetyltransferase
MTLASGDILDLRRLRPADLRAFQCYRRDPVVGAFQGWSVMDDVRATAFLAAMQSAAAFGPGDWWQIGIARTGDDLLIGDIGICLSSDGAEAEIGITLAREVQGAGYGRAAVDMVCDLIFARTQAARIIAITLDRNASMLGLLSRTAFHETLPVRTEHAGRPALDRVFVLPRP